MRAAYGTAKREVAVASMDDVARAVHMFCTLNLHFCRCCPHVGHRGKCKDKSHSSSFCFSRVFFPPVHRPCFFGFTSSPFFVCFFAYLRLAFLIVRLFLYETLFSVVASLRRLSFFQIIKHVALLFTN